MQLVPDLPRHCGSWIAYRDSTGPIELFSRRNAEYAARNGYEVFTALEWLAKINREARCA